MAEFFLLLVLFVLIIWSRSFVASLRFDEDTQTYHWTTATGEAASSKIHPAEPGGDWYEIEAEAARHGQN